MQPEATFVKMWNSWEKMFRWVTSSRVRYWFITFLHGNKDLHVKIYQNPVSPGPWQMSRCGLFKKMFWWGLSEANRFLCFPSGGQVHKRARKRSFCNEKNFWKPVASAINHIYASWAVIITRFPHLMCIQKMASMGRTRVAWSQMFGRTISCVLGSIKWAFQVRRGFSWYRPRQTFVSCSTQTIWWGKEEDGGHEFAGTRSVSFD